MANYYTIAGRRSEYSDEVEKCNKREELILGKQLKILDRQEKAAKNSLKKTIQESERLKVVVSDRTSQSLNLSQYDRTRRSQGSHGYDTRHCYQTRRQSTSGVQLPPLWQSRKLPEVASSHLTTQAVTTRRRPAHAQSIAGLSMMALRYTARHQSDDGCEPNWKEVKKN